MAHKKDFINESKASLRHRRRMQETRKAPLTLSSIHFHPSICHNPSERRMIDCHLARDHILENWLSFGGFNEGSCRNHLVLRLWETLLTYSSLVQEITKKTVWYPINLTYFAYLVMVFQYDRRATRCTNRGVRRRLGPLSPDFRSRLRRTNMQSSLCSDWLVRVASTNLIYW